MATPVEKFVKRAMLALDCKGDNEVYLAALEKRARGLALFVGAGMSIGFGDGYEPWGRFLITMATEGTRGEVENLVSQYKYEEAAELICSTRPGHIELEFDRRYHVGRLPRPLPKLPARYLPRIARSLVVTTNFDRVVETYFNAHQQGDGGSTEFQHIFYPSSVGAVPSEVANGSRILVKLHGDYRHPDNRVLTLSEYNRYYGGPDNFDPTLPIPRVLRLILQSKSVLFLGCSLEGDRTTRVLESIDRADQIPHFALLPDPGDQDKRTIRANALGRWNVRPLFYKLERSGPDQTPDHRRVDDFLSCLADLVDPPPPPRRPLERILVMMALVAVLLFAAAAAVKNRADRLVHNVSCRYARNETQKEVDARKALQCDDTDDEQKSVSKNETTLADNKRDCDNAIHLYELIFYNQIEEQAFKQIQADCSVRTTLKPPLSGNQ
jgi:hypothetical protein